MRKAHGSDVEDDDDNDNANDNDDGDDDIGDNLLHCPFITSAGALSNSCISSPSTLMLPYAIYDKPHEADCKTCSR